MQPLYINSSACISPQETFGSELHFQKQYDTPLLQCIEPDFRKYINPVQIRRMSKVLKMGFSTAIECLNNAGDALIDAIILGTGKGSMEDTEQFLHSIRTYQETALNATHFIHSTYNQVNGAVALQRKINSYNITYVHRAFSFEHCLIDAQLHFMEDNCHNILVGSFDEMTQEHYVVKSHWDFWKKEQHISNFELIQSNTNGTIAGEGAMFMVLSRTPSDAGICIREVQTMYKPNQDSILQNIHKILKKHQLEMNDIDVFISGYNGDVRFKNAYDGVHPLFNNIPIAFTKHLSGEYDTASSFMTWMAHSILEKQHVPDELLSPKKSKAPIRNVLIYNNYYNVNASLILLQKLV